MRMRMRMRMRSRFSIIASQSEAVTDQLHNIQYLIDTPPAQEDVKCNTDSMMRPVVRLDASLCQNSAPTLAECHASSERETAAWAALREARTLTEK
jgi:hypothetical protein